METLYKLFCCFSGNFMIVNSKIHNEKIFAVVLTLFGINVTRRDFIHTKPRGTFFMKLHKMVMLLVQCIHLCRNLEFHMKMTIEIVTINM